jgi:ribonuclease D
VPPETDGDEPDTPTIDTGTDPADPEATASPAPEPVPLLELREPLPPVVEDEEALARTVAAFAAGSGPVAIDAERASGYRYSARAYLVQLRREGAGTALVDPIPFDDLYALDRALGDAEWILHAATQDLPCLAELGLHPAALFDTELAGRLLGYPRVGLATLTEAVLGRRLRKEHSAVDWSTRPLPRPWLEYAALDVEALVELREALTRQLEAQGKSEWARQEFAYLTAAQSPGPRQERWRRTSGVHRARGRRALAAVRLMWETRDEIAARRDIAPGRILPDSAIVEAANALPRDRRSLLGLKGFHGRGAERYANQWVEALRTARSMPEADLPSAAARYDGPPPPRAWADRDPAAAARLTSGRERLKRLADEHGLPVENLLTPDHLRRLLWDPPSADAPGDLADAVGERLADLGARPWQVELTRELLAGVITEPGRPAG